MINMYYTAKQYFNGVAAPNPEQMIRHMLTENKLSRTRNPAILENDECKGCNPQ